LGAEMSERIIAFAVGLLFVLVCAGLLDAAVGP
jgi:hypothetical protein